MIIDVWGQHPTLRFVQDPVFDSLYRWNREARPDAAPDVSMTLALMDAAGVDKMLISAWQALHRDMITNDEVADFVAQSGGRFVGVGSVDISSPMTAVAQSAAVIRDFASRPSGCCPGCANARPPTGCSTRSIRPAPIWKLPFCTQIGHTGPLMPSEVGRPIYLDQVALDFSELTIVGGHIGYPWTEEAIAVATKHENIYIDTSLHRQRFPPELVRYLKSNGAGKILFGTNYPMIKPEKMSGGSGCLGLSPDTKAAFLGGTARKVFNL